MRVVVLAPTIGLGCQISLPATSQLRDRGPAINEAGPDLDLSAEGPVVDGLDGGGTDGDGAGLSDGALDGSATPLHPRTFLSAAEIQALRQAITAKREPWAGQYAALLARADQAVSAPRPSVVDNGGGTKFATDEGDAPGADRGDYDAAREAGAAVRDLGLAYQLSGLPKYATAARSYLHTWCIAASTAMEPTVVNHGPVAIANAGRKLDLYLTMPAIVYGMDLVWESPALSATDRGALSAWVTALASSAQKYPSIKAEEYWRQVLMAVAARLLDDGVLLTHVTSLWRAVVVADSDSAGKFVAFGNSLNYMLFALNPLTQVAELGRHAGVDLYGYASQGCSLRKIVDYHAPFVSASQSWAGDWEPPGNKLNIALFELTYSHYQAASHLAVITHWKRPIPEQYVLGPSSLSHANLFDL